MSSATPPAGRASKGQDGEHTPWHANRGSRRRCGKGATSRARRRGCREGREDGPNPRYMGVNPGMDRPIDALRPIVGRSRYHAHHDVLPRGERWASGVTHAVLNLPRAADREFIGCDRRDGRVGSVLHSDGPGVGRHGAIAYEPHLRSRHDQSAGVVGAGPSRHGYAGNFPSELGDADVVHVTECRGIEAGVNVSRDHRDAGRRSAVGQRIRI